jgi:hypothetical protein
MNVAMEKATSSQQPDLQLSAEAAAELVLMEMYEKFLAAFPPIDAKVVDVQEWILKWFAIDDTYMNDIAVPKFVSQLTISGTRLWSLSDKAVLQYLSIQNVRVCAGSGGQVYEKDIITKLAADIGEAKRRAIPGWSRSCASPEKGKLKRIAEEDIEERKRTKLMDTGTDQIANANGTQTETTTVETRGSSDILQNLYRAMQNQVPEIDLTALFKASSVKPEPAADPLREARHQFLVTDVGDLVEVEDDQEGGEGQLGGITATFSASSMNNTTPQNGSQQGTQSAQLLQTLTLPHRIDEDPDQYGDLNDVGDSTSGSGEESDEDGE